MCIPTHDRGGKVKVTSTDALKGLEGFDPKTEYGPETYKGREIKIMRNTGTEMGKISNLITDMTLAGANSDELARAVRHSMVVIDAEKHKLDYKKSEIDNNIDALKRKYQARVDENGRVRYGGASTILSRSKGEQSVLKRQGTPKTNIKGTPWYDPTKPEGSLLFKTADDVEYTVNKVNKRTGEIKTVTKYRTQKSTRMAETDDANTLVSDAKHPMELLYANYANNMKSLANQARIELHNTGSIKYSPTAKETYKAEVASLQAKLNTALLNTTRERAANRMAAAEMATKIKSNPDMKPSEKTKLSTQALSKYRKDLGSVSRKDRSIKISDREWEAIQAGAISESKLKQILNNTDIDSLRQRATPRPTNTISGAKINRIKSMSASNHTLEEIAKQLNLPTSTVARYLKGQ